MNGNAENTVSTGISLTKGIEVVIQIILAWLFAFLAVKLTSKFGVSIDASMQAQLVTIGTALISGILHGGYNWVSHKWPKINYTRLIPAKKIAADKKE